NGVPIRRAIELNGENQSGSNVEARFARGLDNLTVRPLDTSLPPDEKWVNITYRAPNREVLTLKLEWLVYYAGDQPSLPKSNEKKRAAIDVKKTKINKFKKIFFAAPRPVAVGKLFRENLYAEVRTIAGRDFGYVRLFSFEVEDNRNTIDKFVNEIR